VVVSPVAIQNLLDLVLFTTVDNHR
jgi:hypothetical protein